MSVLVTVRLVVALLITTTGTLVAVFAGKPEAAILATPWAVLAMLGLRHRPRNTIEVSTTAAPTRLLAGDLLELTTIISGATGIVDVRCRPDGGIRIFESPDPMDGREVAALVGPTTAVVTSMQAEGWGRHDVGRVRLEVTSPYGLFRSLGRFHSSTMVKVHPDQVELQSLLSPRFVRRILGSHPSRHIARGVEFADTRPFTHGDAVRDVNWRASARSTELLVSERHPDRSTDVILLLDSFIESGHHVRQVVGLAIEAAVALADGHLSLNDRVGLVEIGGLIRWVTPGSGPIQLQRLTDALLDTALYANAADRNLDVISPQALPPRSFVFALSPLVDRRFIDALLTMAGRSHDVVVVDCGVEIARDANTDDGGNALRLLAAERQMVRDQLMREGIAVAPWRRDHGLDAALGDLGYQRARLAQRVLR